MTHQPEFRVQQDRATGEWLVIELAPKVLGSHHDAAAALAQARQHDAGLTMGDVR